MAIRALIFDFDGLILDTETPMRTAWLEAFEEHGLNIHEAQWASLLGASADPPEAYDLLEAHLGRSVDRTALHAALMARELELLEREDVLPGVRPLVRDATAAGLKLAIASSSERAWVEGLLDRHGLLAPFEVIVCAEDVARTKPNPDLFLLALERLGVRAEEAVALEDSRHGVAAAKLAGLYCVAVPNQVTRCLSFDKADLRVASLLDLPLTALVTAAAKRH